jgi:hypothetical protein
VACRSEVVTDEGALHKFISRTALHRATEHLACPLTFSPRQAAALAAVVEHSILGSNPVFHVQPNYTHTNSSSLVWYRIPPLSDSIGAFAVVGMGAVLAAIVRAPMTSVLIIFEMTGGYGLVLPLMITNMSAFALARNWRHTPIYEALLAEGQHLPTPRRRPGPITSPCRSWISIRPLNFCLDSQFCGSSGC